MTLDPSKNHFDGPIAIPLYGDPDEDGVRPVTGYAPGYHVNASPLGWAALDLTAFLIIPTNPRQVYAGGETFCLRFADETEAREVLADFWTEDEDAI